MGRRLLAISWAMPPRLYPRSIQVSRLLHGLSLLGYETDVVASSPQKGEDIDRGLERRYGKGYKVFIAHAERKFDDVVFDWWHEAGLKKAEELLGKGSYDAILTFGQPWVDHLIGLDLKRLHGLPWLAHFSDPWADNPMYAEMPVETKEQWRSLERSVVEESDRLVFTNSMTLDMVVKANYPEHVAKSLALPHCYDLQAGHDAGYGGLRGALRRGFRRFNGERVRLAHMGNFYMGRNPETLFHALAILKGRGMEREVRVDLAGNVENFKEMAEGLGVGGMVCFHGKMSHFKSLRMASDADALVVLDAPNESGSPFLPSKLVEYLSLKRPVIAATPQVGTSADLVCELGDPSVVVNPSDPSALAEAISSFACGAPFELPASLPVRHFTAILKYEKSVVAEAFSGVLDGMTGGGGIASSARSSTVMPEPFPPLKFGIVAPYVYPLFNRNVKSIFGGSEVRVATIARGLAKLHGFEVHVAVYDHGQAEVEIVDGVHLHAMCGVPCLFKAEMGGGSKAQADAPACGTANAEGADASVIESPSCGDEAKSVPARMLRVLLPLPLWLFARCVRRALSATAYFLVRRFRRLCNILWERSFLHVDKCVVSVCESMGADIYAASGNNPFSSSLALFCRRRGRKMLMLSGSDIDFHPWVNEFLWPWSIRQPDRMGRLYTIRSCDRCAVQTESQRRLLKVHFGRDAEVIGNPVDMDASPDCGSGGDAPGYVLWIGKSDMIKRPDIAIRLARDMPGIKFRLIVNLAIPEMHRRVMDDAASLENVELLESVPFEDSWRHFSEASIFLNTSAFEGFPNTFLQASCHCVPIVSLVVDPDGMLSVNGCGVACGGDAERMREAVANLWTDASARRSMGVRAKDYVKEFHDGGKIARGYARLLLEMRDAPAGRRTGGAV